MRAESQTADDEEKARREEDVVRQGAGWLSRHEQALRAAREEVSAALVELGWGARGRRRAARLADSDRRDDVPARRQVGGDPRLVRRAPAPGWSADRR